MGLVLCDEPLSNLDADLRERMRVEISALIRATGATTVYITHDQAEAFALADRVGVLERGRLVQLGAPEEIYTAPATAFVARFTGLAGELGVARAGPASARTARVEVDAAGHRSARPLHARSALPDPLPDARRCSRSGRPRCVSARPTATSTTSLGTVADVAFRDRGYEHAVDIAGATRINNVLRRPGRARRAGRAALRSGRLPPLPRRLRRSRARRIGPQIRRNRA